MDKRQTPSDQSEVMENEKYRICHALVRLIHVSGGQKQFTRKDFADEVFDYLAQLETEGVIERVPYRNPEVCIYRVKAK